MKYVGRRSGYVKCATCRPCFDGWKDVRVIELGLLVLKWLQHRAECERALFCRVVCHKPNE